MIVSGAVMTAGQESSSKERYWRRGLYSGEVISAILCASSFKTCCGSWHQFTAWALKSTSCIIAR